MSSVRGRGRSTSTIFVIRPGRALITTTRDDRNTASGIEWVTNTIVVPVCSQIRRTSPFIRSRVISSSAPNGSSISRIRGSNESARAIATRCCIPPDSWYGMCFSEVAQLDELEHLPGPLRPRRRVLPRISSGSLTLSSTLRQSNSTGRLEDHPVVAIAARPLGGLAVHDDRRRGGLDEVADDPQQRRLAAARRADERHELARARCRGRCPRAPPCGPGRACRTSCPRRRSGRRGRRALLPVIGMWAPGCAVGHASTPGRPRRTSISAARTTRKNATPEQRRRRRSPPTASRARWRSTG